MKWFKRCCWLAAWCVWLWLGFGLHRELPRDLGPVVCKPQLRFEETFKGFLRGQPSFVTEQFDAAIGSPLFRRRSALTGEIEAEMPCKPGKSERWQLDVTAWHNIVVGYEDVSELGTKTPEAARRVVEKLTNEVQLLDLRTGKWRRHEDLGVYVGCHERHPWFLFIGIVDHGIRERIVVLDVETDRRVFELTIPLGGLIQGRKPWFIGDRVAVPIPVGMEGYRVDVRSIPSGEIVGGFQTDGSHVTQSDDGKIALEKWGPPTSVEIRDLLQGTSLLNAEVAKPRIFQAAFYAPSFSPDGQRLVWPSDGVLFDLEFRRPIWKASRFERPLFVIQPDLFEVAELWLPGGGSRPEQYPTYALRRLSDGSFVFRTWRSVGYETNEDRSLIHADGVIHRLPPRLNWPLLAVCQAILALPLVFPSAILRWRRRRAALRFQP